jgi:hypothetical protein
VDAVNNKFFNLILNTFNNNLYFYEFQMEQVSYFVQP